MTETALDPAPRPAHRAAPQVAIAVESPLQDDVRALIAELNAVLLKLTPPEFCYHMKAEEMAGANTTVLIARIGGEAVAMGAIRRHAGGIGEVKRMYTRPGDAGAGDRRPHPCSDRGNGAGRASRRTRA